MQSRSLMVLRLSTAAIEEVGATPHGRLSIFPIIGGSFDGERLRGRVLARGGDWVTAMADGTIELDFRATLETDDGALILMTYRGVRHASQEVNARIARGEPVAASEYYLRTTPFFETSSPKYAWLNKIVSVCSGMRTLDTVILDFYEVL